MRNETGTLRATLSDIMDKVKSGELDESILDEFVRGTKFMRFIMSYAELHDFSLSVTITATTNTTLAIANMFLDSGLFEQAFDVVDSAIEILQQGKSDMMDKFNNQTDEGGVPPI